MSLPPPPQAYASAPGQQPYDPNPNARDQSSQSHMPPPPLPPVVIPQNQNPIPTAVTSGSDGQVLSPGSATSSTGARRAAPEPNKRALYVGGLDPRVTEDILRQIFETTGHVQNVKIIPDKNMSAVSLSIFLIFLLFVFLVVSIKSKGSCALVLHYFSSSKQPLLSTLSHHPCYTRNASSHTCLTFLIMVE